MPALPAVPPFQKAVETEPAVHEDAPPRQFRCMHYRPPEIQHVDFAAEYPWRIHSHGHSPCLWDACANGSFVAESCLLTTTTAGGACDECARLQYNTGLKSVIATMLQDERKRRELDKTQTMSGRPDYRCSLTVMGDRRTAMKSARDATSFKILNAQRKLATMAKALSVHKRLTMLLQQNDVPKLRQTIGAALGHGASMGVLLEKLAETIEGTYKARGNFSETQYDAVTLVVRLGGPKLLYALARPLGLPSLSDWRRHRQHLVRLCAGAGLDDLQETTMHNLVEVFGDPRLLDFIPPKEKTMWCWMIDELAINPLAGYHRDTKRVLGFCFDHSSGVSFSATSHDNIQRLRMLMDSGAIHCCGDGQRQAKEALVLSIAPFGNTEYYARAAVILPTCKAGDYRQQLRIMHTVEKLWDEHYSTHYGRLGHGYSDGDATRRVAFEVDMSMSMGEFIETAGTRTAEGEFMTAVNNNLKRLKLLDRKVTKTGKSRGFDMKHIFKRWRKMARSARRGTEAGTTGKVVKSQIKAVLVATGTDVDEAEHLLTPDDDQSVPEAVKLMRAIRALIGKCLPGEKAGLQHVLTDLQLWAEAMDGMLDIALDLKKNLNVIMRGASKVAHMVFKIYFDHGTKAMPGQLYHDLQRSINDLFQSVARRQSDPTAEPRSLYTFQLGTDRQEVQFAGVRTENHDRSMTPTRLPESLSHELQIRRVFSTNPAFRERGSRRLGHSDDHVNVRSTEGDRDVDAVDLLAEWVLGRADAVAALVVHPAYSNVSEGTFTALAEAGHTMMHPHKKRVGVKLPAVEGSARAAAEEEEDEEEEEEEEEEELNDGPAMLVPTPFESEAEAVFESMIPDPNETPSDLDAGTHRVDVDGESVNTAMVVRQVLGRGSPMSNDRLRRVRGMGKAPKKKPSGLSAIEEGGEEGGDEDPDFPEYDSMMMLGDPVAIIVQCRSSDSLAFATVETILIDGSLESSVSLVGLQKTTTKVTVRLATVILKSPFYVITGVEAGQDSVVTVSGNNVSPLSYTKVDKAGLYFACDVVDELVLKPVRVSGAAIKFSRSASMEPLYAGLVIEGSTGVGVCAAPKMLRCLRGDCGTLFRTFGDFRTHNGGHYLNGDFGTAPSEICGYCGVALEGDRCRVVLKADNRGIAKIGGCSCPCFDSKHSYKSSLSSTTKTPCTNVPVLCQEDPCKGLSTVFFRYNIAPHFRSAHDDLDVTEVISKAMAKLTTAGPTVDISGELSLIHQRHMQARAVVLAIHNERSLVVAKFKSQKVRSAAAVALPTTTAARAAAAAAERDPIFSASNLGAGSGFFAAATPVPQGEVEGCVDTPMEGGGDGEAQV